MMRDERTVEARVRRVLLGLISAALLVLAGCGGRWTAVPSEASGFVAAMPGAPVCRASRKDTSLGRVLGRWCEVEVEPWPPWRHPSTSYSVAWWDLPRVPQPEDAQALIREVEEGTFHVGESRSAVVAHMERSARENLKQYHIDSTRRVVSLGGAPALEYATVWPNTFDFRGRTRLCVKKNRLYRVSVAGYSDAATERAWARMLDSFHFVPDR